MPTLSAEATMSFKWTKNEGDKADVLASPSVAAFGNTWRIVHHVGEQIQLECLRDEAPNSLWNLV